MLFCSLSEFVSNSELWFFDLGGLGRFVMVILFKNANQNPFFICHSSLYLFGFLFYSFIIFYMNYIFPHLTVLSVPLPPPSPHLHKYRTPHNGGKFSYRCDLFFMVGILQLHETRERGWGKKTTPCQISSGTKHFPPFGASLVRYLERRVYGCCTLLFD